jgi:hypothetical protein
MSNRPAPWLPQQHSDGPARQDRHGLADRSIDVAVGHESGGRLTLDVRPGPGDGKLTLRPPGPP